MSAEATWRLPSTGSCQRTSAKTSCSSGASPARLHSPASGSSSSDAAMARCAATQAARAAARSGAGTSRARCPASRRSQVAASAPNRPPTSTPTTTKRQRQAHSSSGRHQPGDGADDGGVYGLLRAMPESKSVRDDLDAAVVSNRHIDIHVGQADITGNTRAGFLADPRSSPFKREGPGGEHAGSCAGSPVIAEWVEATTAGARTRGDRQWQAKPAQHQMRNKGEVTVSSAEVGKAVKARAACGPACDSSSARDAASR